jgi:two-component system OmpR family sensor kinase
MRNLAFSLLSVVLIATIGLGWMFDNIYSQYQAPNDETNQATDVISILEKVGIPLAQTLDRIENRQQFTKSWPLNSIFTLKLVSLNKFPLPQALAITLKSGKPLLLETDDSIALHFYLPHSAELLVLTTSQPLLNKSTSSMPFLLTTLFYLAILFIMFLWLYPLAKRLLALRQTAKLFGEGDLTARINVGSISYIRDIELEFNRMAQRIDDLVNDIKLLSSAVSHDLRTPLARIRFGIDTISEEDDPILRKRFEQRISDNVDEMVELVESLLSYARLDQTLITLNKESVDLSALLTRCINNKSQDDIELIFSQPEKTLFVEGDISYLMILFSNLIQNAYQYCQGKIQIEIIESHDEIIIIIADDGQGIAFEQRDNVMKPFIRGKHHNETVKGYGMGLAIVKRIVEWHQGCILINSSKHLSGAQFTVHLPKTVKSLS